MTECPSLPLLNEAAPLLLGDDANDDVAVSSQYYECATRQRGLIKWLKEKVLPLINEFERPGS